MAKTIRFMELLGGTSSFEEAFSDLEEALIQYYEIGDGIETIRGFPPSGTYTNPHQVKQPRMRCSNNRLLMRRIWPRCWDSTDQLCFTIPTYGICIRILCKT
jgi:hypothetical protein